MNFDWSTYLAVARHLSSAPFATEHQEAALRSSISRAYYAAFCTSSVSSFSSSLNVATMLWNASQFRAAFPVPP